MQAKHINKTELLPDREGVPPMAPMPEAEVLDVPALLELYRRGDIDLICVVGPTASGKTAFAVRLARELSVIAGSDRQSPLAEILSGDSRQVYRGMDIGTGKDLAEYQEVPCPFYWAADERGNVDATLAIGEGVTAKLRAKFIPETNELPVPSR